MTLRCCAAHLISVSVILSSPLACARSTGDSGLIDRRAVVSRHNVKLAKADPLSSLSVGNGEFAFTVDISGLQTFPEAYEAGISLGTQSQWGWHSFEGQSYGIDDVTDWFNHMRWHTCPLLPSSIRVGGRRRRQTGCGQIRIASISVSSDWRC